MAGGQLGEPVRLTSSTGRGCRLKNSLLIFSSLALHPPAPKWPGLAATAAEKLCVFSGDSNQYFCLSQEQAPQPNPRREAVMTERASQRKEERSGQGE